MDLSKAIETYLGRPFINFVELELRNNSDGKGDFISKWNIVEKEQPTLEELQNIQAASEIQEAKNEKLAELQKSVDSKLYFSTSVGNIGLQTIVGNVALAMKCLLDKKLPDYTGKFFTYEGAIIPDLTLEAFNSLYDEVFNKYMLFDGRKRTLQYQIGTAKTIEGLNLIVIDFTDL